MDPSDAVDIGRRIGRRVCPRGPWTDDVIGAATEAAWKHPDTALSAAYCAAVDELRRLTKARRRPAVRGSNASRWVDDVGTLDRFDVLGVDDDHPSDADLGVDLTRQQAQIVALLGLGFSKADTAHVLGITSGTLSFHLARLRRIIRGQHGEDQAA